MSGAEAPWYGEGLRFACTGCGSCCRGEGYVWVDGDRAKTIARHLDISLEDFSRRYLRRVGRRFSLIEKPNDDCIFWEQGCAIYAVRPRQCRTFPFWKGCIASPEDWEEVALECAGVGGGPLYSAEEITRLAQGRGATTEGPPAGRASAAGAGCAKRRC